MSRTEYRKVFSAHGAHPLQPAKVTANGPPVRVEFDRLVKGNIVVLQGDPNQTRLQLPKEDRGAMPLATTPLLLLWMNAGTADLIIEVDVTASLSVAAVSASGAPLGPPAMRRITQRISAATFHTGPDDEARRAAPRSGADTCRLPLPCARGAWALYTMDLAAIVADFTASAAAEGPPKGRPQPPNLFAKASRQAVAVLALQVDRVVLSGTARLKEIASTADMAVAEQLARDQNLPLLLVPGGLSTSAEMPGPATPFSATPAPQLCFLQRAPASPAPTEAGPPGTRLSPQKQPQQQEPLVSTPSKQPQSLLPSSNELRSVPAVSLQLAPDFAKSPLPERAPVQLRFSRDSLGKIQVSATDLARERLVAAEEECRRLEEQRRIEADIARRAVTAVIDAERSETAYARLLEPEAPTDRFGVRLPSGVPASEKPPPPQEQGGALDAWRDGPSTSGPAHAPPTPAAAKAKAKGPSGGAGPPAKVPKRVTTLDTGRRHARLPVFASKMGQHVDGVPPLPPAPSSLLLASVMKKAPQPQHLSDQLRLIATPVSTGMEIGIPANVVLCGRTVGYGVGCLDVIHSASESGGTESTSESADDTPSESNTSSDDTDNEQ